MLGAFTQILRVYSMNVIDISVESKAEMIKVKYISEHPLILYLFIDLGRKQYINFNDKT